MKKIFVFIYWRNIEKIEGALHACSIFQYEEIQNNIK